MLKKCFIAKSESKDALEALLSMCGFVHKLHHLVKEYGTGVLSDYQARADVKSVAAQFTEYSRFFYQLVRKDAYKGKVKELFLRLDFNKYFQHA